MDRGGWIRVCAEYKIMPNPEYRLNCRLNTTKLSRLLQSARDYLVYCEIHYCNKYSIQSFVLYNVVYE